MNAGERLLELFATLPPPGSNLDWYEIGLLAIAAETPSVTVRLVPDMDATPPSWHLDVEESGRTLTAARGIGTRVFRPLLARLAVIAAEETGGEFQPYGGRYSLTRALPGGPVRLDVEFSNTTGSQRISITRAAVPESVTGHVENGSIAPHPRSQQPAT